MTGALVFHTPRAWSFEAGDDFESGEATLALLESLTVETKTCEEPAPIPAHTPSPREKFLAFTSSQSCKYLFETSGPLNVLLNNHAGVFSGNENWAPICSAFGLHEELEKLATKDISIATKNLSERTKGRDACVDVASDRDRPEFKAVSPASLGLTLFDEAGKKGMISALEYTKASVADQCCGTDKECLGLFKEIETIFCDAPTDLNKPTRCVDNGVMYISKPDMKWWHEMSNAPTKEVITRAKGNYNIRPGSIMLSPYVGRNGQRLMIHELGHACSRIQRGLAINRGSEQALQALRYEGICKIMPSTLNTYSPLFKSLGLTDESFQCVVNVANTATEKRFEKGPCPGGCPRSHLEEAFAAIYPFFIGNTVDLIQMNFPRSCYSLRDTAHPYLPDLIGCMALSPKFKNRFTAASSCKR